VQRCLQGARGVVRHSNNARATAGTEMVRPASATEGAELLFCGSYKWDTQGRDRKGAVEFGEEVLAPHRLTGSITLGGLSSAAERALIERVYSGPVAAHAILLLNDGRALAIGRNTFGELGIGTPRRFSPVFTPVVFTKGGRCIGAACGRTHTLFLMENGDVYASGANDAGQLGIGARGTSSTGNTVPAAVTPIRLMHLAEIMGVRAVQVACGDQFSIVLADDGSLYTFGTHRDGVLGLGTTGEVIGKQRMEVECEPLPRRITRFIRADGTLIALDESKSMAEQSDDIPRFTQVVCGQRHAVALDSQNRVWSWGFGGYGRLGHRTPNDELRPRSIELFERFRGDRRRCTKLFAGASCCYALTEMGSVYFWGITKMTGEATVSPQMLYDLHGWKVRDIAVGISSTMVACDECATIAWGPSPAYGEMGFGETVVGRTFGGKTGVLKSSTQPRMVETLKGVQISQLAMGAFFTFLLIRPEDIEASEGQGAAVRALPTLSWDECTNTGSQRVTGLTILDSSSLSSRRGRKPGKLAGHGTSTATGKRSDSASGSSNERKKGRT
jgi:alpha-tubulin suppressor-like RCC1 family protein